MTRDEWLKQIALFLQPASDPELAANGIMQPQPAFRLTFSLPNAFATAFPGNLLNISDDDCLMLLVRPQGRDVIIKVAWSRVETVAIEFSEDQGEDAGVLARQILMGNSSHA